MAGTSELLSVAMPIGYVEEPPAAQEWDAAGLTTVHPTRNRTNEPEQDELQTWPEQGEPRALGFAVKD